MLLHPPDKLTTLHGFNVSVISFGYITMMTGCTLLSRIIWTKLNNKDIFNKEKESFPQQERLNVSEYSINLPATYYLKGELPKSWINIINPFRSVMVSSYPGAGKSYFVIWHVITQYIQKAFAMFVYDFKFDDLFVIAYNHFLNYKYLYPAVQKFYVINFDEISRTHRCNPLDKENMLDITDASESARQY